MVVNHEENKLFTISSCIFVYIAIDRTTLYFKGRKF